MLLATNVTERNAIDCFGLASAPPHIARLVAEETATTLRNLLKECRVPQPNEVNYTPSQDIAQNINVSASQQIKSPVASQGHYHHGSGEVNQKYIPQQRYQDFRPRLWHHDQDYEFHGQPYSQVYNSHLEHATHQYPQPMGYYNDPPQINLKPHNQGYHQRRSPLPYPPAQQSSHSRPPLPSNNGTQPQPLDSTRPRGNSSSKSAASFQIHDDIGRGTPNSDRFTTNQYIRGEMAWLDAKTNDTLGLNALTFVEWEGFDDNPKKNCGSQGGVRSLEGSSSLPSRATRLTNSGSLLSFQPPPNLRFPASSALTFHHHGGISSRPQTIDTWHKVTSPLPQHTSSIYFKGTPSKLSAAEIKSPMTQFQPGQEGNQLWSSKRQASSSLGTTLTNLSPIQTDNLGRIAVLLGETPSSDNSKCVDSFLQKADETCKFLEKIAHYQGHTVNPSNWSSCNNTELIVATHVWLQEHRTMCTMPPQFVNHAAWEELVAMVDNDRARNCWLGGPVSATTAYIDSPMAKYAGFKWLATQSQLYLVWNQFARQVSIFRHSSILHAHGQLLKISVEDMKSAEPLPTIWSIGFEASFTVPHAEEIFAATEWRRLQMLKQFAQRKRDFQKLRTLDDQLMRTNYIIRNYNLRPERVEHECNRYKCRMATEYETSTFEPGHIVQVQVPVVFLTEEGVAKQVLKKMVHTNLTGRLGNGPFAQHRRNIEVTTTVPEMTEGNPIGMIATMLKNDTRFQRLQGITHFLYPHFVDGQLEAFARAFVLMAIVYDSTLTSMRRSLASQSLCSGTFGGSPGLVVGPFHQSDFCASGWKIDGDRHLKTWHDETVFICNSCTLYSRNMETGHLIPIDTDGPVRCIECLESVNRPCRIAQSLLHECERVADEE